MKSLGRADRNALDVQGHHGAVGAIDGGVVLDGDAHGVQGRSANRSRRAPARNLGIHDLEGHRVPARGRVERGGAAQVLDPGVVDAARALVRVLAEQVDADGNRRVDAARLRDLSRNLDRDGLVQQILDRIGGRPEVLDERPPRILLGAIREIDGQLRTTRAAVETVWPCRGLRQGGLGRIAPCSPLLTLYGAVEPSVPKVVSSS